MPVADALHRFPPVTGHLDAATSGVPPTASVAATRDAVAMWAGGQIHGRLFDGPVERSRVAFARLLGVDVSSVAIGPQVSPFTGLVAASLEPGSEVLVADEDFTSVLFPAYVQRVRGVTVRSVPLDELIGAISAATTLVAVSAVQSADGRVLDLDALATAADHHGADVFLDATQAAGWLPVDGTRFAYVVAGTYKFLLAPRGTALLAVRPDRVERLVPHAANWYATNDPWASVYRGPPELPETAKRFDISPAWICWAGTAPSLELVCELGVEAIGAYDVGLANRLRAGLGMEPSNSAIVIAEHPEAEVRLTRAGLRTAVRDGRVRMACHLPTTTADVDRAIEALSA